MTTMGRCVVLAVLAMFASVPGALAQAAGVEGVWIDHTGRGAVELKPCAAPAGRLCGEIFWLQDTTGPGGKALTDENNPDKSLRRRPICGLPVISNTQRQTNGSWDKGKIYDPDKGETFDVELKLLGQDQLQVTGYLGVKFLSETFKWKRAPATLTRCGAARGA